MKTRSVLLSLFTGLCLALNAQVLTLRSFGGNWDDRFAAVRADGSGCIYTAGSTQSFLVGGQTRCGWLLKLDQSGDTLWSRSYADPPVFYDLLPVGDGGLICVGGTENCLAGRIMRVDNQGVPLWVRSTYGMVTAIASSLEGGYYAVMGALDDDNSHVEVVKLTASGDLLWSAALSSGHSDQGFGITATPDSGVVISGCTRGVAPLTDGFLTKLDKNGTVEWGKAYGNENPGEFLSVINAPGGGFLAVGTWAPPLYYRLPIVMRLNALGDTLWTRSLKGYADGRAMAALRTPEGAGYLVLCEHWPNGEAKYNVTAIDDNGNFLSTHTCGTDGRDFPSQFVRLPDGRIAIAGVRLANSVNDGLLSIVANDGSLPCETLFEPPPMENAPITITPLNWTLGANSVSVSGLPLIASAHPLIHAYCGSAVGVEELGMNGPSIFPNPAHDRVIVRIGMMNIRGLEIYNTAGQLVRTRSVEAKEDEISISRGDLTSGLYAIQLISNSGERTRAGLLAFD